MENKITTVDVKDRKDLTQEDIKWVGADNYNETSSSFHAYYPYLRSTMFMEPYEGNAALCHHRLRISEDDEGSMLFEKLEAEPLHRLAVCKRCLKIYDKLPKQDTVSKEQTT